jgi:fucose permease
VRYSLEVNTLPGTFWSTSMPPLSPRATLAVACAIYAAAGLSLSAVGPSLAALAANVAQPVAALGAQFTAFSTGTVLVQLVAAPLGARFGQRAVLSSGALLLGLGMLGESLSGSLTLLLLCALLGGLGFGCVLAAGVLLVTRLFPARGTSALNLVNLFFGVGAVLGPLVADLGRISVGRPEAALMLGAVALLALAPVIRLAAETPSADRSSGGPASVPWGVVLLLGLLLLLYSGSEIAVGGWATLYLEQSALMAPAQVALALSGFWLALTAGRALGALLGLRVPAMALLGGALALILGAAGLLVATVGNAPLSVLGLLLLGLGCGPVFPTTMALVAVVSQGRGGAASMALAIGNVGAGLIPPLLGVVLSDAGPRAGITLLLWAALAMLLLFGSVAAWHRRRAPALA